MDSLHYGRIASAFEKIGLEVSLFRIRYESECTNRRIKETFASVHDLKESIAEKEPKVQKNIDDWRDYLHKYSLVLLSSLGFFIGLVNLTPKPIDLEQITTGFIFICISLVVVFFAIFSTIFLQRKIIDGNFSFGLLCKEPYTQHPDEVHYHDAIRRNLKDGIEKVKEELKNPSLNKKEKRNLKKRIQADKRMLGSLKYSGGTYLWLEQFRGVLTVLILATSLIGLYKIGVGFIGVEIMHTHLLEVWN